jgi:hypothetical protein
MRHRRVAQGGLDSVRNLVAARLRLVELMKAHGYQGPSNGPQRGSRRAGAVLNRVDKLNDSKQTLNINLFVPKDQRRSI